VRAAHAEENMSASGTFHLERHSIEERNTDFH
jgi:hypothetical protein